MRFSIWIVLTLTCVLGCQRSTQVPGDTKPDRATTRPERLPESPQVASGPATEKSIESLVQEANTAFYEEHRMSRAEAAFLQILKQNPNHTYANAGLAFVRTHCGRRWESTACLMHLVRVGQCTQQHLSWLGVPDAVIDAQDLLTTCHRADKSDPLPILGLAKLELHQHDAQAAERLLHEVIEIDSSLIEAHAVLGSLIVEGKADQSWVSWNNTLPQGAETHPDIWAVRGMWSQEQGKLQEAVRCFGESVLLNPNHPLAVYRLSQLLRDLEMHDEASVFASRSEQLLQLSEVIHQLEHDRLDQPQTSQAMRRASELCEQLGRIWESVGWCLVASKAAPSDWIPHRTQNLLPELNASLPQTKPSMAPATQIDFRSFPLPQWDQSQRAVAAMPGANESWRPDFQEVASAVGLEFAYRNGHQTQQRGVRMYEVNGGGVGVIDFDNDGWPDLYWTQGSDQGPFSPETNSSVDQLFRNLSGKSFEKVTPTARIRESGFSQGVSVGDFNSDGFADIYVANIGNNRLLQNQGDGTFIDVTSQAGLAAAVWTSSCLMADLNGDALPDLYDVNYLRGDDLLERVCDAGPNRWGVCVPAMFDAQPDQVFINQADGTFGEVSQTAGVSAGTHIENSKGLGIVAADFNDDRKLDLFIANDHVNNHFYINQTDVPENLLFVEQAFLSGLAVDWQGRRQACMGVAAADVNGDNRLDLYVTNFYAEANCLYIQQPSGLFADQTRQFGLADASFNMLGFGVQWIDGELDGQSDLFVANGHIEDRTAQNQPFQMPAQYFRCLKDGRFKELSPDRAGEFFRHQQVARSVARLDWNRDGLEDLAVSNIHAPASLITNRTQASGNFISFKLIGTDSCRDPVGAILELTLDQSVRRLHLTAGDGYQASNERCLVLGTGSEEFVQSVAVKWPSGRYQKYGTLPANQWHLLVEGRKHPSSR